MSNEINLWREPITWKELFWTVVGCVMAGMVVASLSMGAMCVTGVAP